MAGRGGRIKVYFDAVTTSLDAGANRAVSSLNRVDRAGQKLNTNLATSTGNVRANVRVMGNETESVSKRVGAAFGSAARSAVRFTAVSAGLTGVGVAVGRVARTTVDFDRAMRNVNSIAQLSERDFQRLSKSVRSLAGPTAQSPQVLAEGMYDLVSSGFKANDAIKVLNASARAATAGLTDTAVSAKVVAGVLNAYRLKAKDASAVSDTLFRTVDRGVITFEQLAQGIGPVLPFATNLKVPLREVGAAIATMTKQGIPAANAMTYLRQTMVALNKPSDGMKKAFDELGVSGGEELVKKFGSFQAAMKALIETTDGSSAQVSELFQNVRAQAGAFSLTGENAKGAARDLRGFQSDAGATSKALEQQSKSIAFQWTKLKATASNLSITVGNELVGALQDVFNVLNDPRLTGEQKFDRISDMIVGVVEKGLGLATEAAGRFGPKIAGALVKGFISAPLLVQLFAGAWIFAKGRALIGAFGLLGASSGAAYGTAMTTTAATTVATGGPGKIGGALGRFGGVLKTAGGIAGGIFALHFLQKAAGDLKGGDLGGAVDQAAKGILPFAPRQPNLGLNQGGDPTKSSLLIPRTVIDGGIADVERYRSSVRRMFDDGKISGDAFRNTIKNLNEQLQVRGRFEGFNVGKAIIADHRVTKDEVAKMKTTLRELPPAARKTALDTIKGMLATLVSSGDLPAQEFRRIMRRIKGSADDGGTRLVSSMAKSFGSVLNVVSSSAAGMFPPLNAALKALGANPVKVDASKFALGGLKLAVAGVQFITGQGKRKGKRAQGGFVDRPMVIVGEEAPTHPEFVIATNPAYRERNVGLFAQAGRALQVPGFKKGGRTDDILKGGVVTGPPGALLDMGKGGVDKLKDAAKRFYADQAKLFSDPATGAASGGGQTSTKGLVPQVTRALAWARGHGWSGQVTSGFRTEADQVRIWNSGIRPAAKPKSLGGPGSNHQTGQAVDVTDVPGFARAMGSAPPNALLKNLVPNDALHFSVTGHRKGGIIGMAKGGVLGKFESTSYGPPWGGIQGTGTTKTGINLKNGPKKYLVAVDPSVIPLGSKLKITPNPFNYSGTFTASDIGGAIKGNRIDFYDWRGRDEQLGWGRRNVTVTRVTGKDVEKKRTKRAPTGSSKAERIDYAIAQAEGTPGSEDDVSALRKLAGLQRRRLKRQRKRGNFGGAAGTLRDLRETRGRIGEAKRGSGGEAGLSGKFAKTFASIDRDAALAGLSDDANVDDLRVERRREELLTGILDVAKRRGDTQTVTEAAQALKSTQENIRSLGDTGDSGQDALAEAIAEQNRLLEESNRLREEQIAGVKRVEQLTQAQGPQIIAALTAVISGDIGGRVGLGRMTPGTAGTLGRY